MTNAQIFVANWLTRFGIERGFIGWPDPDDLNEHITEWLDVEALHDLATALSAMLADRTARKGHKLAMMLLQKIKEMETDSCWKKFVM